MKIHALHKIVALLLLATLLVVNAAAAADDIWCVGSDGHLQVKPRSDNGCCEAVESGAGRRNGEPALKTAEGSCGPCLDITRKKIKVTLLKRHTKISPPCLAMVQASCHAWNLNQQGAVSQVLPALPKRISQALLAHRTVVLLS